MSSEVPRYSLEFVILAFGGQAHWTGDDSDVKWDDKRITHYVTDRNPDQLTFLKNRYFKNKKFKFFKTKTKKIFNSIENIFNPNGSMIPSTLALVYLSKTTLQDTYKLKIL